VIVGAALCASPPLLHPALTGRAVVLPELRAACAEAVARLLRSDPGLVAVVGPAAATGDWDPSGRLDPADSVRFHSHIEGCAACRERASRSVAAATVTRTDRTPATTITHVARSTSSTIRCVALSALADISAT